MRRAGCAIVRRGRALVLGAFSMSQLQAPDVGCALRTAHPKRIHDTTRSTRQTPDATLLCSRPGWRPSRSGSATVVLREWGALETLRCV